MTPPRPQRDMFDRLAGDIRVRVVALGLAAALPSAGLAGFLLAEDFSGEESVATERAGHLHALVAAHVSGVAAADASAMLEPALNAAAAQAYWASADAEWVFDAAGDLVGSTGAAAAALPKPTVMAELLRSGPQSMLARSDAGARYAFAASDLPNGWHLVTAYEAGQEHQAAVRHLITRLVGLAGLLLLGLAMAVHGGSIALGGSLRRLRGTLLAWQAGARFDSRGLSGAPDDVLELAHAFERAADGLRDQQAELDQTRQRQDLLMLEIHHRVKNNLQIVASLLNLQASRIRVPEARAEFQSARDRVRALATLHRHLYSEGEIQTINMPSFLTELCSQLFQAMGVTEGERISLQLRADELRLSTDLAVPLALIVTEAVTNAIKYGFPGGRSGTVSVTLAQAEGAMDLTIADDGVGIPTGEAEAEAGNRDGIGLQLIRGFSRQLGATLDVREQPGTCYTMKVPLAPRERMMEVELGG